MPYYFYYQQQTVLNSESKNTTYCFTDFPSFSIEVTITLYTIVISYILPLLTIIFCYIGMTKKFLKKSTEQNMLEHSIKFSNLNNKAKSLYLKRNNNGTSMHKIESEKIETSKALLNVSSSLMEKHPSLNDFEIKKETTGGGGSLDNITTIFSRFSFKRTLKNKLSNNSQQQNEQNENIKIAQQKKTKILILIGAVSITFTLTWLPAHTIQIWRTIFRDTFPFNDLMYIIKVVAHTLSYSNSFINPFIYIFVGSKFKSHIKEEFNRVCGIENRSQSLKRQSQQSTLHLNDSRSSSNYLYKNILLKHKPTIEIKTRAMTNENDIEFN
jgi:hypothetical protein